MPEVGPVRVEDAGAGADDVDCAEGGEGCGEEGGELGPGGYVCGVEEGGWGGGGGGGGGWGVSREEVLGFGAEGEVGEEDVAAFGQEEGGEGVVYALGGGLVGEVLCRYVQFG